MQNRVDIQKFILQIEQDFPVNNWKINEVHLWPILRIRLFFYLIDKIENKTPSKEKVVKLNKSNSFLKKVKNRIKMYTFVVYYFFWKLQLPKKKNIFVGSDSHRVNYRNSRFNRYFDVIIEKEKSATESMYFEYASDLENQYNKSLIYKYSKALKGFLYFKNSVKINNKSFQGYSNFLLFLNNNPLFAQFVENNNELTLTNWYKNRFGIKILFFHNVLQKIAPKRIAILCYYSEDIYALLAAANKIGIETIEMQHGPQTDIHLAYGSWSMVPKEGYGVLPRIFWCWDEYSKNVLEKWISKNELYKVEVVGNPWVTYWKNKEVAYFEKDFVLYSLQPNPITLEQLFTPEIIKCIKNSNHKWFIRLHPRQLDKRDEIKDLLKNKNILKLVNLDEATNDALPQLLMNAKIHITHSSGSALESSYFGLKTILINEIGLKSFPHLIENKNAIFIDYRDSDFFNKMKKVINVEE